MRREALISEDQEDVRAAVEEMASIKERIREKQEENSKLAKENEELRQFSMNGFKIAQNVDKLTAEREKLSVDLADQADQIRKLMDQNKELQE